MKKSITVSNLTLSLYLDYVRPAAIKAGLLEDAITEDGKPYHITDEALAKEIESDMRCACFNAGNDGIQRTHEEYIAHEAEQMLYQIDVSIKYCKDSKVVEALQALRDAMTTEDEAEQEPTAAEIVEQIAAKVEQTKTRSAWERGVKEYAEELLEELAEAVEGGYVDESDLSNRRLFEKPFILWGWQRVKNVGSRRFEVRKDGTYLQHYSTLFDLILSASPLVFPLMMGVLEVNGW